MNNRLIYHIDVNSAFLSWESIYRLQQHPTSKDSAPADLRNTAAVIGGDETMRHGIVLAKSIHAKKYGIRTGEPLAKARQKCPHLIVVTPHFDCYVRQSKQFIDLLSRYSPTVEQYSIDEAFCDMSGTNTLYGDLIKFAHTLKEQIYQELGFTVNIGISTNKLLAKMASGFEKPDQVHTLFPTEINEKLWPLPVNELFFVGPSTARRLNEFGIRTIGELALTNRDFLMTHFKKHGNLIWKYANGFDDTPVEPPDPTNQCYGNSITIHFDVTDSETAKRILLSLCETIGARLRNDHMYISVISVTIRDSDFHNHSCQLTLPDVTNVTERIYDSACTLFDQCWNHAPIRLLGVSASHTSSTPYEQMDLFDSERYEKLTKLNQAIDSIRSRYGEDSVRRACFIDSEHSHMTGGLSKAKR